MDYLEIAGGVPLIGDIKISGAKNAALPLLAAGLMTSETLTLDNVPNLADTILMEDLLRHHGLDVARDGETVTLAGVADNFDAPYDLVRKMRASILVLGPLLARFGEARVSLPGGCAIGTRPVDLHIRAMQALGAVVELADGYIQARSSKGLKGARVVFPMVSVGATENAMMAAALADGTSELVNVAREPEIIDLANCLNAMGAQITGAGTDTIVIEGVASLGVARHAVVADRIEAGTFAIAAAMTEGDLRLQGALPKHLDALIMVLREAGADIEVGTDYINVRADKRMRSVDIVTDPFPGFPTDLQAQFMAMMCVADGSSRISETIFENRFMHVPELVRMGADIRVDGGLAVVRGRETLTPAPVMATDLRASVSLVLAALATIGTSKVSRIYHLDRGYSQLETKLGNCGAQIIRKSETD
ncbi:UDP-N-acetylglucosamine 1-carboxyvinyltransferase [Candidatus Puniceispirillum marinum]|uniref:UDP-N-acetylglucosamine 1-carboxyvinyltransferase n=1 Tax=Puniceispirillum marinum (strain IMCC1322) TaxID=488538 RepID=D5BTG7_PUNMI|nr:UDP-N-acetylglucosamine 1-carboxyvinyltransferase [Candidatus Puniceispirillum marinum]ADE39564.1 UDP-N-acetylglucosamine 1-carboxyvinyltransferase [Candidatus Puniceispirillum marinum IMCC1322]